jgi:hypothetical protein
MHCRYYCYEDLTMNCLLHFEKALLVRGRSLESGEAFGVWGRWLHDMNFHRNICWLRVSRKSWYGLRVAGFKDSSHLQLGNADSLNAARCRAFSRLEFCAI